MTRNIETAISRRRVLRSSAALTVAGLGQTALAQEDGLGTEIELGGRISGWVGQSPDAIADERNPTLRLVPGEEYTITWENLDGAGHNFAIEDESGEEQFVETEILAESGATQTVEFTAQEEMAEYYCQPHPTSMRGTIEFGDGGGGGADAGEAAPLIGDGPTVGLETVAEGLTAPLSLETADEEADRRFIVDQTGYIYVHDEDGLREEPFLDVSDRLIEFMEFDERGLLGLAFHPEFSENGRFFVRYSAPPREGTPDEYDHTFVLSEFRAADDGTTADPDSERAILELPQPQFNHNSGEILFGPDGYLYVGTGDGGGGSDVGTGHVDDWYDENDGGNGQDTSENLLGAILRIDVDSETSETSRDGGDAADEDRPYGIPDDNPLVDQDGQLGEHYAWGFRNPWGVSFTDDGQLLAADVGQELFESVNYVRAGGNYSWNVKEGTHCFSTEAPTEPPADCPDSTPDDVRGGEPLLDPVLEYPHEVGILEDDGDNGDDAEGEGATGEGVSDGQIGVSITGGHLYEGGEIDALEGTYVFGDWSVDGQSPGTVFLARPPDGWQDAGDGGGLEGMFLDPPTGEDGAGNETDTSNQTASNETAGNETEGGNETAGDVLHAPGERADGAETEAGGLWPIEQIQLEGEAAENGRPTGFVYAFGEGADGELYVLTTSTSTVEGDGAVHRLVPAEGDGDTEAGDDESAGDETATDDGAGE